MAQQNCPNCKNNSFTWKIDEEISELTIWECQNCNYKAFENEVLLETCPICKTKTKSHLIDEEKEFWWCSNCNLVEKIA